MIIDILYFLAAALNLAFGLLVLSTTNMVDEEKADAVHVIGSLFVASFFIMVFKDLMS